MTEFANSLLQKIPLDMVSLYTVIGVLAAALVLVFLFRMRLGNWREERQISRMLRRLGARRLRGLQLPDGMGGEVIIDHLLLSRDALLVVGVKRFSGLIFGGPQTDQAAPVHTRRSISEGQAGQRDVNTGNQAAAGTAEARRHPRGPAHGLGTAG
jgi:hypothetical protein